MSKKETRQVPMVFRYPDDARELQSVFSNVVHATATEDTVYLDFADAQPQSTPSVPVQGMPSMKQAGVEALVRVRVVLPRRYASLLAQQLSQLVGEP